MSERPNKRWEKTMLISGGTGVGTIVSAVFIGASSLPPEVGVVTLGLGFLSPIIGTGVELNRIRRDKRHEQINNQVEKDQWELFSQMTFPISDENSVPIISAAFSGTTIMAPDTFLKLGKAITTKEEKVT